MEIMRRAQKSKCLASVGCLSHLSCLTVCSSVKEVKKGMEKEKRNKNRHNAVNIVKD